MNFGLCKSVLFAAVIISIPAAASAQSGSTGGTIGDDQKSISGSRPSPPQSTEPKKPARQPPPTTPHRFEPMGSGAISNGNCKCKDNCRQSAQLNAGQMAQCISTCEKTYSGCNKGQPRWHGPSAKPSRAAFARSQLAIGWRARGASCTNAGL
jgi:hypothetical protein